MGMLDNSTNNIVVDSVLTDIGREFLARNDGSFSIVKFALSDEEVDYEVIKHFGRTIGKEKIEKNTPIFEGLTNQNHAQKHLLISVSNPNLIRLPNFSLTGEGLTSSTLSMGRTITKRRTITVSQNLVDETTVDVELRDQAFQVDMNNLFLKVSGGTPDSVDSKNVARYLLTRDAAETSIGGSKLTLTLELRNIPDERFTVYGNVSDKNTIQSTIILKGLQSSSVSEITVKISKSG